VVNFHPEWGAVFTGIRNDQAGDFSEDLAPVYQDGKWGYIDKTGKMVIQPQFLQVKIFPKGWQLY